MRKTLTVAFAVLTFVFGAAALLQRSEAAFSVCGYKCICSVPNYCCTSGGVTKCKPAPNGPLQCTQGYEC